MATTPTNKATPSSTATSTTTFRTNGVTKTVNAGEAIPAGANILSTTPSSTSKSSVTSNSDTSGYSFTPGITDSTKKNPTTGGYAYQGQDGNWYDSNTSKKIDVKQPVIATSAQSVNNFNNQGKSIETITNNLQTEQAKLAASKKVTGNTNTSGGKNTNDSDMIIEMQKSLNKVLGTNLKEDGIIGPKTQDAIQKYNQLYTSQGKVPPPLFSSEKNTSNTPTKGGEINITKTNGTDMSGVTETTGNSELDKKFQELNYVLKTKLADATDALEKAKISANDNAPLQQILSDIGGQYDRLAQQVVDKNNILMGSIRENAARGGSMQYANEMYSNFTSDAMDRGAARVLDVYDRKASALAKATKAYKDGQVELLDKYQKEYDNSAKELADATLDWNKAVNDHIKDIREQERLDLEMKKEDRISANAEKTADLAERKFAYDQKHDQMVDAREWSRINKEKESKILTPAEIKSLTKQYPALDISYGDTESTATQAVANAKKVSDAIDTDFNNPEFKDDKGYFTDSYIKDDVLPNLPDYINKIEFLKSIKDKLYLDKYKFAKNYGINREEYDQITAEE